jgi:SRSO17 transposase
MGFCEKYDRHFISRGRNSVGHARNYLTGLFGTQRRKNIETIENDVTGSDYQGMEQFISSSPWSHRDLLDDVARDADALMGDENEAGLFLDESSFLKKGDSSVGVQRQWSGRAGKVENCQVGVFASLARGDQSALIDFRLYLPESWAQDAQRCDKAKIPEGRRAYQPKWVQALEMVRQARANGVRFGWVGADSLYGNNQLFLNALEDDGEKFMADVHRTLKVWLECPDIEPPRNPTGKKGRPAKRPKLREGFDRALEQSVGQIVGEHFDGGAREIGFRQGSKGRLTSRFWSRTVWIWDEKRHPVPRMRTLLVREDESGDMKYSLTNLPGETELPRLAYVQNQRYWIEHAFHEAKSQLGMAQYQVRVWQGWHHHMALVCLATVFMAREKSRSHAEFPLLSCRDIVELLDHYLPRRNRDEKEMYRQIKKRHAARQRDIDRRKRHKPGLKESGNITK